MGTLEVTAQDARDIYQMACEAIARVERAQAKKRADDPVQERHAADLGRLKRLRDAADALQQIN